MNLENCNSHLTCSTCFGYDTLFKKYSRNYCHIFKRATFNAYDISEYYLSDIKLAYSKHLLELYIFNNLERMRCYYLN